MAKVTIGLGVALIVLGVVAFVATGSKAPTALIPVPVGIIFGVLGIVALNPGRQKHAMHAAAALGLIGFLGTIDGVIGTIKLISGGEVAHPPAAIAKAVMSVLCLAFVVLCVRSFINARRAREMSGPTAA